MLLVCFDTWKPQAKTQCRLVGPFRRKAEGHPTFSEVAVTDPNLQSQRMQVPATACGKSDVISPPKSCSYAKYVLQTFHDINVIVPY